MSGWGWVCAGYGLTAAVWAGYAWWVARSLRGDRP
jgi:hypothetical protein